MNALKSLIPLGFAALATVFATSATAQNEYWSHKSWNVSKEGNRCSIWTGGDGSGTFGLAFETGGYNSSATYLPVVYRGYPLPIQPADSYEILIDKRLSIFGDEMAFFDGTDTYGSYYVAAGLTGGFVPEMVASFRRGNGIDIRVERVGEVPFVADSFSLSGFTATYLKASEWCRFDPNNLFRS